MTPTPDVTELVRNFASNGFKYLLRQPDNLRDLLRLHKPDLAGRLDYANAREQPGSFVAPDFRHLESDLLLRVPLLNAGPLTIDVYVLIEHQSEPDDLVVWRALRYQMAVFEWQLRQWLESHPNARGFRFHPVLPIVFYSGTRTWERLTPIAELVEQGELIAEHLPALTPVFFNLAGTDEAVLRTSAGLLGWVLLLIQQRRLDSAGFRALLGEVVGQLEGLPRRQQERWRQLMWFLHGLVYHYRAEADELAAHVRQSVRSATHKKEAAIMVKTAAERLKEEGKAEGLLQAKRQDLLRLIRNRFKSVPRAVTARVQATEDLEQLDAWFDLAPTADRLADIPFHPAE
jgi:predicted transposase YdaD